MKVIIVSGGSVTGEFIKKFYQAGDKVIAVDKGLESVLSLGLTPEVIIGDFDSVEAGAESFLASYEGKLIRLNPVKDDTDTEAALDYCIAHYLGNAVILLGATGTRFDHTLANVYLLGKAKAAGLDCMIVDTHNRMRLLVDEEFILKKEDQYGSFISLLPIGGDVFGVSISGVKYPLCDATLHTFSSLGVSNEILSSECHICTKAGTVLLVESKDR